MQDTTITLGLQLAGASLEATRINVSECIVKIGKLDIKIGGMDFECIADDCLRV